MIRRLVVTALFSLAMIAPAAATAAPAAVVTPFCCNAVPMERETYYYSDASKTVQVGYKYENSCIHQQWLDGVETPYYTVYKSPCNA
jgi:hypothetical protein